MAIRPELLDELLKECENPEELLGQNGLLKELTKGLVERMLHAEMTDHLGYEKHASEGHHSCNSRNGTSPKKLKTEQGEMPLEIPHDRNGSFDPKIIRKGQTRFDGFDDKILSMYARGMTTNGQPRRRSVHNDVIVLTFHLLYLSMRVLPIISYTDH
jgi:putative transposase